MANGVKEIVGRVPERLQEHTVKSPVGGLKDMGPRNTSEVEEMSSEFLLEINNAEVFSVLCRNFTQECLKQFRECAVTTIQAVILGKGNHSLDRVKAEIKKHLQKGTHTLLRNTDEYCERIGVLAFENAFNYKPNSFFNKKSINYFKLTISFLGKFGVGHQIDQSILNDQQQLQLVFQLLGRSIIIMAETSLDETNQ